MDNVVGLPWVTSRNVPASEVPMAASTSGPGRVLRASANQATIMVGDRNCSTVAVAAFDFSMVIRKVYCTVSAPNSEKNSRLKASLRFCRTRKILSPCTKASIRRIRPANSRRVMVRNGDDIWLCCIMYCAQTPELPHSTAAISTFSIPFLLEPIFSSNEILQRAHHSMS